MFPCIVAMAVLSLFANCKKEISTTKESLSYAAPTIKLTKVSAKDSAYLGDSCTISGVVITPGKLSKIQFFRSFLYNGSEAEVEVAKAKITKFPIDATTNFSVAIANLKDATKFRVQVTDQIGQVTSSVVSITIRKSNILAYYSLQIGGWDSWYGSCLDVDTGTPMSGSATEDPELRPFIDVFFDEGLLANIDLDAKWYGYNRLPDTGIRYATTTFTSADFDKMKSDELFKDLEATLEIVPVSLHSVVFFKAKSGKKGLLRVAELTGPTLDLLLDEKIQK